MDKVAIGSRLREARNMVKLTQEQLAEKVGIGTNEGCTEWSRKSRNERNACIASH